MRSSKYASLPCEDLSGRLSKEVMGRAIRELRNLIDEGSVEVGPYDADVDGDPADLVWMTDSPPSREEAAERAETANVIRLRPRK